MDWYHWFDGHYHIFTITKTSFYKPINVLDIETSFMNNLWNVGFDRFKKVLNMSQQQNSCWNDHKISLTLQVIKLNLKFIKIKMNKKFLE